jgi:glycine hydroxymethyltransferase
VSFLKQVDSIVFGLIEKETHRQQMTLNMIAAENTAPLSILEAVGSAFNNKTAEGYPGRRYHTGCEVTDELERLAVERAKALFGAGHANVQPHSGVNANLAVYQAVLQPGDSLLSMKLSHGGHLSHGDAASFTGRVYRSLHYGVRPDTEMLDVDEVRDLARKHRPRMIIAGASSYPKLIDYEAIRTVADEISAYFLVDMAHIAGLVAAEVIPSPVPHADFVTFTTYKTMMGPHGGIILCREAFAKRIDRAVFPGTQGTPTLPLVAAKAVCFKLAATPGFVEIQRRTVANAKFLCDELAKRGYRPVTGGSDNHLILIDLRSKGLKGDVAEKALEEVGIMTNRNVIPFDPESTNTASGLRLGTAGITIRGMGETQVTKIADLIDRVLSASKARAVKEKAKEEVHALCLLFPLKPNPCDR